MCARKLFFLLELTDHFCHPPPKKKFQQYGFRAAALLHFDKNLSKSTQHGFHKENLR